MVSKAFSFNFLSQTKFSLKIYSRIWKFSLWKSLTVSQTWNSFSVDIKCSSLLVVDSVLIIRLRAKDSPPRFRPSSWSIEMIENRSASKDFFNSGFSGFVVVAFSALLSKAVLARLFFRLPIRIRLCRNISASPNPISAPVFRLELWLVLALDKGTLLLLAVDFVAEIPHFVTFFRSFQRSWAVRLSTSPSWGAWRWLDSNKSGLSEISFA